MQSATVFNKVSINIIRNFVRLYVRKNPGVQKRINLLKEKDEPEMEVATELDDLETDFMDVGHLHKAHKQELKDYREKEKYLIVGRKYFRENQVNFLTWNDKEQIRYLYNSNPNEWTPERLSEGFPALPDVIYKISTNKWEPKSIIRKKRHDQMVEKNWKLLKENKLELPSHVIEHVKKFSDRNPKFNLDYLDNKIVVKESVANHKTGEFSSILENYNRLKNKKEENVSENYINFKQINKPNNDDFEKPSHKTKKSSDHHITLTQLRENINARIESGKNVDEYDRIILKETNKNVPEQNDLNKIQDLNISSSLTTRAARKSDLSVSADQKIFESLNYPEKIVIPKEKHKKNFTYKVNDCYYDDDGHFLYRVPGMY